MLEIDRRANRPIVVPDLLVTHTSRWLIVSHGRSSVSRSPFHRSLRFLGSRSSGASSGRAVETESETKESTVLRIAHRSRRSLLLLYVLISPHSLPRSSRPRLLSPFFPSVSPPPSRPATSLLIHLPICLSVYLCRRSSLFITPTSRAQLTL